MKTILFFIFMIIACKSPVKSEEKPVNYLQASTEFIEAAITGEFVENYISLFEHANLENLQGQLAEDKQKITFWVNVYNGYIQYFLKDHPEWYQDRRAFFKERRIKMGTEMLSFEDIEHGILRRSQHPWLFGYGRSWFPSRFEKKFRVEKIDYRIHFVLNCGAKSCPPVRILDIDSIEFQLKKATSSYILSQSTYQDKTKTVNTTPLFSWFRGDFGGKKGVKKILTNMLELKETDVQISYTVYDWTLDLNNYVLGDVR